MIELYWIARFSQLTDLTLVSHKMQCKKANTPRLFRSLSNHSDPLGVFNRFHGRLTRLTLRETPVWQDMTGSVTDWGLVELVGFDFFWIFGSFFNPRFLCGLIQQGTATERTALRYELCAKMRKASLPSGERWGLVEVKKTYGVSTCIYSIDTWTILFSQDPNRSYLALNKKLQNCSRSPEWKRENMEVWRLT